VAGCDCRRRLTNSHRSARSATLRRQPTGPQGRRRVEMLGPGSGGLEDGLLSSLMPRNRSIVKIRERGGRSRVVLRLSAARKQLTTRQVGRRFPDASEKFVGGCFSASRILKSTPHQLRRGRLLSPSGIHDCNVGSMVRSNLLRPGPPAAGRGTGRDSSSSGPACSPDRDHRPSAWQGDRPDNGPARSAWPVLSRREHRGAAACEVSRWAAGGPHRLAQVAAPAGRAPHTPFRHIPRLTGRLADGSATRLLILLSGQNFLARGALRISVPRIVQNRPCLRVSNPGLSRGLLQFHRIDRMA